MTLLLYTNIWYKNRSSASQEIPRILWILMVPYRIHKKTPLRGMAQHPPHRSGIHNGKQKRSRENFTIWSSATLADSDCLTVRPSSTVSRTLPYKEIYVWLSCPHLPQPHILIAASHSMSDKNSGDIGGSQTCVNVSSSSSCTETCNKAYITGQKGAWSSIWQLVLRLCSGHLQRRTQQLKLGLIPSCRILTSSGTYIPET
jgi:hypothetical protein